MACAKLQLAATGVTLVLSLLTRSTDLVPLLLANALVGAVYMTLEWKALQQRGSVVLGRTVRVPPRLNVAINLLAHVLLTALCLLRTRWSTICLPTALAIEVCGLLLFDIERVYPTDRLRLRVYVAAHVTVFLLALAAIRIKQTTRT
jgi:hypothetical protein